MQERFNRYCLTKEIASKSSGSVYLAHHINHVSHKVTLKIFKATSFTSEQQGQYFLQKIERIRQLKHSAIVPILDLGVKQGHPYVVREYLTSNSLRHRFDGLSPQRLDLQEVLSIIFQIGQALCYAHEHSIFHGNLKPENIFFNDDGEVLLTDFGLTSFTNRTTLDDQSHQHTTSYLAPEQLVGSTTEKSDQYALACLAYELITGCAPFSLEAGPVKAIERRGSQQRDQAESACHNSQCPDYGKVGNSNIRKFGKTRKGVQRWQCRTCQVTWSSSSLSAKSDTDLIPLTDLAPNLPEPIEEAMLKAMAKDPAERYADISIFLRTLQIAFALPPSPSTNSPIASPVTSLPTSTMMPFERVFGAHEIGILTDEHESTMVSNTGRTSIDSSVSIANQSHDDAVFPYKRHRDANLTFSEKMQSESLPSAPLLERREYMQNDYHASKSTTVPSSDIYRPNKPTPMPNSDVYRPNKDLIQALPEGRRSQPSKPLAPTLWLAFALSGIALLLGTIVLYAIIPPHSPGSSKHVNSSPTVQPSVQATSIPIIQSPSPTPAPANSDPYLPSGTLALSDPLRDNSRGYQWQETPPTSSNGGWSCQFTGGAYYAQAQNGIYATCHPALQPNNFTFEVHMQIINGNCGGLTLRDAGNGDAYSFQVCQDGSYQFNRLASSIQTLTSGSSATIAKGSNQSNLIALVANGSHFDLYANHQKLASVNDSSYSSGAFGLTANAAYTNARMWTL